MVVCVEDRPEIDTVSRSRDATMLPATGLPSTVRTSSVLFGLFSPMPASLKSEKDCTAYATSTYVHTRIRVVMTAAMPGVLLGFLVSSPTARQASQPQ